MKILKRLLLGIAALIAVVLITALFVKKSYSLTKEVTINLPVQEVFDYIRMNKHQPDFNAWSKLDPATKNEFRGTDGEVGSVWTWNSEPNGQGEQTITAITPNKEIDYKIHFITPMDGEAINIVKFEAIDENHTKVINDFSSSMPYPFNFMCLFMSMDEMIGSKMQEGLNNIKTNLEK